MILYQSTKFHSNMFINGFGDMGHGDFLHLPPPPGPGTQKQKKTRAA